ncbi:suppressor protein SRP40 [Paecilomyces variotii No. 5]|uniref:Suppressor protein SRP40 n=1 Tax=Byssochlamys spectabilis (strain No. 5 / NBRC 109023) TaxID=1356009 RepID=V5I0I3_BYSSN|nr:suppressor protein SRP40 [Paecilomyces variotii No. 5]
MTETTKRLHITPLTPELLDSVLAPSVRSSAADISFHSIETFPENSYGYVTLPAMEADKLKKKLHGSILKGKKFKVEEARPRKRSREEEKEEEAVGKQPTPEKKKSKKRKSENGVLEGHELPSDRHVKRGWTEPASAKREKRQKGDKKRQKDDKKPKTQAKSKYTENAECLFRTKTPANRTSVEPDQKKEKKSKKNKAPDEVTIHEFSKTVTYPSFLRADAGSKTVTTEFVEGKGWVDSEGNVKEPVSEKITKSSKKPGQKEGVKATVKSKKGPSDTTPSKKKATKAEESSEESGTDWTSSSGSSSDDDSSDSESEEEVSDEISDDESEKSTASSEENKKTLTHENNSPVADSDDDEVDDSKEDNTTDEKTEVHPLEALFKRPAPKDKVEKEKVSEENTQFTFFGGDDLEDEDGDVQMTAIEPQTPFTKRDLQERGLRSAAPTPDTALHNRTTLISHDNEDEGDEEMDDDEYYEWSSKKDTEKADASGPKDESDFAEWFWEHRGENNRSWKKRRRDAAKEKRQRENRKKGMKGRS